jgi:hypothetical protein
MIKPQTKVIMLRSNPARGDELFGTILSREQWLKLTAEELREAISNYHDRVVIKMPDGHYNMINRTSSEYEFVETSEEASATTEHEEVTTECGECIDRRQVAHYPTSWPGLETRAVDRRTHAQHRR